MNTIYVVMPVYNSSGFLKQSISSVLRQSFTQFKLIIVDDGSTDGSEKIYDEYAARDARITVIHQKNAGSFLARKAGIAQCADTGYITFLDADDRLPPDALQIFWDAVQRTKADVCVGRMKRMWKGVVLADQYYGIEEQCINRSQFFETYFCSWYGITRMPVNLCGKLFRADALKKAYAAVPEHITRFFGDDLVVSLHCLPQCDRIYISEKVVYDYRIGGNSGKYRPEMLTEFLALYRYKLDFAKAYTVPQDLQLLADIELCNVVFSYAKTLYAAPQFSQAQRLEDLREKLRDAQIVCAAQHVLRSDFSDKRFAQWIADGNADALLAAAKPSMKDKMKSILFRIG